MAPSDQRVNPHLRLTWGGDLGVPAVEQWTNGLRLVDFGDGDLPDDAQLQLGLNAVAQAIEDWFKSPATNIGSSARLTWAKLNRLDEYGHQPGETIRHDFASGIFGAGNSQPNWNTTYAVTFRTAKSRGRAHAGRIFPPACAQVPVAKTPYCADADAQNLAATTGMLLLAITEALHSAMNSAGDLGGPGGFDLVPTVVSPGSRSANTQEVRNQITSCVVDRVADVQHRRTRQVPRLEGPPYVIPYT